MLPPTTVPNKDGVALDALKVVPKANEAEAKPGMPRKCINTPQDLEIFTRSKLCNQLVSFVTELAEATKGLPLDPARKSSASPLVLALSSMLDQMESWIEDFPPLAQPMRFGNKAFRNWHQRLCERGEGLLAEALSQAGEQHSAKAGPLAAELSFYLRGSFGDERRIDYGTGHEVAFLGVLFALGSSGLLARADAADAVLVVFSDYMRLMRRLQKVYLLEPAGSHGVWGLDDYHMLPFVFGAAQLIGKEEEVPTGEVYREKIVEKYADQYLYVDAIRQVLLAKRGAPFHETSPMLYDITSVPDWQRTLGGMIKMWKAEVLSKFPVIQHFLFGPTLQWPGA
ncbi:unnamed protein product [Effrenium voratum]|nr:unnamed protein product [Effrenium voratum]